MQSPLPTISLILLYFLFVCFGPRFMKDRPAFEMKMFLFFFNAAIVVFYVYLTREVRDVSDQSPLNTSKGKPNLLKEMPKHNNIIDLC